MNNYSGFGWYEHQGTFSTDEKRNLPPTATNLEQRFKYKGDVRRLAVDFLVKHKICERSLIKYIHIGK